EIALHHEIEVAPERRHAERTRERAVPAADAALGHRGEHDALRVDLDGVGGADARARRVSAVPADRRRRLPGVGARQGVEVDDRVPAVAGTLAARLLARAASDATVRVNEEFLDHPRSAAMRSMRTAATLNSGIFAIGS